jgi:hypothetical protein
VDRCRVEPLQIGVGRSPGFFARVDVLVRVEHDPFFAILVESGGCHLLREDETNTEFDLGAELDEDVADKLGPDLYELEDRGRHRLGKEFLRDFEVFDLVQEIEVRLPHELLDRGLELIGSIELVVEHGSRAPGGSRRGDLLFVLSRSCVLVELAGHRCDVGFSGDARSIGAHVLHDSRCS